MGDLNDYFSKEEFACRCQCGYDSVSAELLQVLTDVRQHFNSPVAITSGCRCQARNKAVGGEEKSRHLPNSKGETVAADFKVANVKPIRVQEYLEEKYPDKYGIGRYPNRTHVDVRPDKARWTKNV
jgi:uncharacterized protein YcbK (DUF882 family)